MVDSVALARRRRKRTGALIVAVVTLAALGKSLSQTIIAAAQPPPPGYVAQPPQGSFTEAKWDDLRKGRWDQRSKPRVADAVAALDGQPVHVKGFMLPLHTAGAASEFFVAASPGGCYFCSPPGVAEVVMVRTQGGQKMEVTQMPVEVYGKLKVAAGTPDDQALYLLEDGVFVVKR